MTNSVCDSQISAAVSFLTSPSVREHPDSTKRSFLKSKELSDAEVLAAFARSRMEKVREGGGSQRGGSQRGGSQGGGVGTSLFKAFSKLSIDIKEKGLHALLKIYRTCLETIDSTTLAAINLKPLGHLIPG